MSDEPSSLRLHLDRPSAARIYDYLLDPESPNNYAIDRQFAEQQLLAVPDARRAVRENRRFICRAVETALARGITQFIDIGAGLPSKGQPHEVADRVAPEAKARVVYVDNEMIAHAHANVLLADHADPERHKAVLGDFFNHGDLWSKVKATGLIDLEQPTCLIVAALLHFMPDEYRPDIPLGIYRNKLAPGSMLVLSHGSKEDEEDDRLAELADNYKRSATNTVNVRVEKDILPFFGDWDLIEPGVVWVGAWRPKTDHTDEPWWEDDHRGIPHGQPWWGDEPERTVVKAGVAIKR